MATRKEMFEYLIGEAEAEYNHCAKESSGKSFLASMERLIKEARIMLASWAEPLTAKELVKGCEWIIQNSEDMKLYATSCGNLRWFDADNENPIGSGYNYCPKCGGKIKVIT